VSGEAPSWDRLYEAAAAQDGLFSTRQAAAAGYSPQLLAKYLQNGRVRRVHFPARQHEDLVAAWLWAEREGVFSHETALSLHELSDVLPARVHLTLPAAWLRRRLRVPEGITLHYRDVGSDERAWVGAVPVTTPRRTLTDCLASHVSPETIEKATRDAVRRGLLSRAEITAVEATGVGGAA
jgi:predicted transcriptional regulator of viral defense system